MGSPVRLHPVETRRDLKRFIRMPDRIYADDPNWVRPLMMERLALLDRRKNPYFDHAEVAFWLAERDGATVGRISAQVDRLAEERFGERIGHFGLFESVDDPDVAAALFGAAEDWLRAKGCVRVQGPFNLSINSECGMLVEGFETPPAVMMGHARPYYRALLEGQGYVKAKDLLAFELDLRKTPPQHITRFVNESLERGDVEVRQLDKKKYDEELSIILDIFNDAWANNWGFIPMTPAEAAQMAREIKPLLDPRCVEICRYQGEDAAMFVTLPDFNSMIADFNGSLLPFNWLRLLPRLGTISQRVRVPLMGVRQIFQNSRAGAAMAMIMIENVRQRCISLGATWGELSWILEDNTRMQNILVKIGCQVYKTYRIFEKPLQVQATDTAVKDHSREKRPCGPEFAPIS